MAGSLPKLRVNCCSMIALLFAAAPLAGALAPAAYGQTNLVTNGNFTKTGTAAPYGTLTTSEEFGTFSQNATAWTPPQTLTGWSSAGGYNFVFLSGATSATGTYGDLRLWGPGSANGSSNNGFQYGAPDGKGGYTNNYLALDADYIGPAGQGVAVTQTLNGLTAGQRYNVSFAWAAAQQYSYTGSTTDQLQVSFGSSTQKTALVGIPQGGFSGWLNTTMSFVASTASQTLSFLATGNPAVPPFILLANVSVTVPEPGSIVLLASGLAGLAGFVRGRRSKSKPAKAS